MRQRSGVDRRFALQGLIALWLGVVAGAAWADDPAPVSATPEATPRPRAGSVTTVTREEIERRQWRTLADVLRAQPGLHLSQLGGRGQDALLFLRGNPNGAVLLRMDGIDLSDPSGAPLGTVNDPGARAGGQIVPDLLTENIEKIEIIRGPQSARYGSDAIGGVIEIETRRGSGAFSPWASFEVGGFGTTQESAGFGGGTERAGYSFAYSNAHTRGISATPLGFGSHERDANENDTVSGRFDFAPTDGLTLRLTGRFIDEDAQLDQPFAIPLALAANVDPRDLSDLVDTRALQGERRRLYLGAETSLSLLDDRWVQTFGVRYSDHDVREDADDSFTASFFPLVLGTAAIEQRTDVFSLDNRDGQRLTYDWRSDLRLTQAHTLTIGAETERESIDAASLERQVTTTRVAGDLPPGIPITILHPVQRQQSRETSHGSLRNNALWVADRFSYERFYGELALRLHDHDTYGSGLTYRAAIGYVDPGSKARVFASIGTAFRDPDVLPGARSTFTFLLDVPAPLGGAVRSLGETLVVSTAEGDRTLDRAVSRGIELGVEVPLLDDRVQLGATLFSTRVRDLQTASGVQFFSAGDAFVFGLDNSVSERTRGVELAAQWRANAWLGLAVDYTYTHAELAHVRGQAEVVRALSRGSLGPFLPNTFPIVSPSGSDLTGVPKHQLHTRIDLQPFQGVELSLAYRYVGERAGVRLGGADRLGGYGVWDVTTGYALTERVKLYGRIENLFDKEYSDLELSGQPGFAGFVGLRAEL